MQELVTDILFDEIISFRLTSGSSIRITGGSEWSSPKRCPHGMYGSLYKNAPGLF